MHRMAKIALCFLSYGDIEQKEIWRPFFESEQYTIFLHRADGHPGCNVIPHRATSWGTFSLVQAQQDLFNEAIKDPAVTKCVLLSGDSIPLYSPAFVFEALTRDDKGYIESHTPSNTNHIARQEGARSLQWPWKVGSQWVVLTRKHVEMIQEHWTTITSVFEHVTVADEHVYPTFFNGCLETFHTKPVMFVNWSKIPSRCPLGHRPQPATYHVRDLTPHNMRHIYSTGCLFMRKLCSSQQVPFDLNGGSR